MSAQVREPRAAQVWVEYSAHAHGLVFPLPHALVALKKLVWSLSWFAGTELLKPLEVLK